MFKKKNTTNTINKNQKPNAMIFDEKTKTRIFRFIEEKDIPIDSFPRDHKINRLYVLGLDLAGKYFAIAPPTKVKSQETPTAVFIAKHCAEEVNEFYGLSSSMMQKIKIGILVAAIIAVIIVIFLIVTTVTGGKVA
jgi:hypothetical protein